MAVNGGSPVLYEYQEAGRDEASQHLNTWPKNVPRINLVGHTYGRLHVLAFDHFDAHGLSYWRCRCSCEAKTEKIVRGPSMREGTTLSCGCLLREYNAARKVQASAKREARAEQRAGGALRRVITKSAPGHNRQLNDGLQHMTVLGPKRDPYRFDTPKNRYLGAWFRDQVDRFVAQDATTHIRGMHYLLLHANVIIPSYGNHARSPLEGKPYQNTEKCYNWLYRQANAARWLGYLGFDRLTDERNSAAEIYVPNFAPPNVCISIAAGKRINKPQGESLLPKFRCLYTARQPYRIAFCGEKSSLGAVLRPIAQRIGAELLLPSGETSATMVAACAQRAALADWPLVILYFSDFDPSGNQMAVSTSRKLQALRDLVHPNLNAQLHPIALTLDQVKKFDLPSIPVKDTEARKSKWSAAMGRGATEIDALLALHPGALREMAEEAIKPFYDPALAERTEVERLAWEATMAEYVERNEIYAENREAIDAAYARIRRYQSQAHKALEQLTPIPFTPPQPEIFGTPAEPLFTTAYNFVTATQKLKRRKAVSAVG